MTDIHNQISTAKLNELQLKIWTILSEEEKYKDPLYTARQLSRDLGTNARYLSAVLQQRYGKSYSALVNELRVKEAIRLMNTKRGQQLTMEQLAKAVGYSCRQTFYNAFTSVTGGAPAGFKRKVKNEE